MWFLFPLTSGNAKCLRMAGVIPTPASNIVNHLTAKSATQHNNSHEIEEREF